ncbi:DUF4278 domain-containing protein [Spirulina subsalsa FACHB-351]|uniref:DUF4278 domain-containing protein n=1 Tax=Spirulina subsalsa FACHB-351 TaxID=234711 RepID=A0ABT3L1L2_9CYAN|nr:DUF4278 domain-containing protein [Spirulina subsalsa]MCW6035390.1 DUF4278 domain-containing protein [Spirulina subsalsa FACHB-351]
MELCYRGVHYQRQPLSLEVSEGELSGKYRGQSYNYRYPRHIPTLQTKPPLKYRGVAYQYCPMIQTENTLKAQLAAIAENCGNPAPVARLNRAQETAQVHLYNMRRNLEYRLQVARARGDQNLIGMLEKESRQLAL